MARIARVVAPGIPHHITQRGNRRQLTFFQASDYQLYLDLALEWSGKHGVQIWAYCLMPNHVHLIAVPEREEGLALAISEIHRRYTRAINFRMGWRGYLWQGRFHSFPMDQNYLLATARYIEMNPVKAGLVSVPHNYPWSSCRHHLGVRIDPLVSHSPLNEMVADWTAFLAMDTPTATTGDICKAERIGRPLGSENFLQSLEATLKRSLQKNRPGPKTTIK